MIYKVEARSPLGELLTVELEDVTDGLVLEDIDGLDPVKATLVSTSFANLRGAQFQASNTGSRNLTLKLGLEPDYVSQSVKGLRDRLYAFFMPEDTVSLRIYDTEGPTVDISGKVEDFVCPLFVKEPVATIYIQCFGTDFIDIDPVIVAEDTVADSSEILIEYPNNGVKVGVVFTLNVDRVLTEFTIYHRPADDVIRTMIFALALEADDILTVTTVEGNKSVMLLRDSTLTSVLYGLSPESDWLELLKGDNHIRVYAEGAPIPYSFEYTPRYGGL